ncbi:DNA repair and recombination protein Rhp26p [Giardia lamblia P15]|uniref:DNA repair and recombination protein Rhp26p n=1 Tax=Giardia intestinalis (strain P15) TaxID=658858 RepID=E1EWJ4_GIAIA|nr:DNA repair and recombination protein Rhp26p [Giardia lamblia P15]
MHAAGLDMEDQLFQQELQSYHNEISSLKDKLTAETNQTKRKSLELKLLDARKRLNFFIKRTNAAERTFEDALGELEQRADAACEPEIKHVCIEPGQKTEATADSTSGSDELSQFDADTFQANNSQEYIFDSQNDLDVERYLERIKQQTWINGEIAITNLTNLIEIAPGHKIYGPLYASLRKYQQTGVRWILRLFSLNSGGLLADEPGVGKTVQTIVALSSLFLSGKLRHVLLVVPSTIQTQWLEMVRNWWPLTRCILLTRASAVAYGISESANDIYTSFLSSLAADLRKCSSTTCTYAGKTMTIGECGAIFISSYDFAMRNAAALNTFFQVLTPKSLSSQEPCIQYAIFDEVHYLKNTETIRIKALRALKIVCKLGISATPVQNSLVEIYSLITFIQPNILGDYDSFLQEYDIPIRKGSMENSNYEDISLAASLAQRLANRLKPYILRRLKSDVERSLPPKVEHLVFIRLSDAQEKLYIQLLSSDETITKLKQLSATSRSFGGGITKLTMAKLIQLQHICDHPSLLSTASSDDSELCESSCKLTYLMEQLTTLWNQSHDKVLVFCQGRMMLNIVERIILETASFKNAYLRMDGNIPVDARPALISRFSTDPQIRLFLLTTRVGGLGLNLTAANHVFLLNPNWNPTIDDQSVERCWRITQSKKVIVYKVFTGGTIEEKIFNRQIYKRLLVSRVLDNASVTSMKLFKSDLFQLFTYNQPDVPINVITKEINVSVSTAKTGESIQDEKKVSKEKTIRNKIAELFSDDLRKFMKQEERRKPRVTKEFLTFLRIQQPQNYLKLIDAIGEDFCNEKAYVYTSKAEEGLSTGLFAIMGYCDEDEENPVVQPKKVSKEDLQTSIKEVMEIACSAPSNTVTLYAIKESLQHLTDSTQKDLLDHLFLKSSSEELQTHTLLELKDTIVNKINLAGVVQEKN